MTLIERAKASVQQAKRVEVLIAEVEQLKRVGETLPTRPVYLLYAPTGTENPVKALDMPMLLTVLVSGIDSEIQRREMELRNYLGLTEPKE